MWRDSRRGPQQPTAAQSKKPPVRTTEGCGQEPIFRLLAATDPGRLPAPAPIAGAGAGKAPEAAVERARGDHVHRAYTRSRRGARRKLQWSPPVHTGPWAHSLTTPRPQPRWRPPTGGARRHKKPKHPEQRKLGVPRRQIFCGDLALHHTQTSVIVTPPRARCSRVRRAGGPLTPLSLHCLACAAGH